MPKNRISRTLGRYILQVDDDENDVRLLDLAFKRRVVTFPVKVAQGGQETIEHHNWLRHAELPVGYIL